MTVPVQTKEELLSLAHVSAIVASTGHTIAPVPSDFGVDLGVRRIGEFEGRRIDLGVAFDLQLKATINWTIEGTEVIYDMEADAYNRLVTRNQHSATPCILVLCCLPNSQADWLEAREAELVLRKCSYFFSVGSTPTPNARSVRLKIPRDNLLTPVAMINLIDTCFNGGSK